MVLVGPPETSWASEGLFSRPKHQIHWKLHNQDTKTLSNWIIMESFIVSKDKTDRDGHSLSGKKIKRVSRKRRKLPMIIEFCVVVRRLQDAQAARDASCNFVRPSPSLFVLRSVFGQVDSFEILSLVGRARRFLPFSWGRTDESNVHVCRSRQFRFLAHPSPSTIPSLQLLPTKQILEWNGCYQLDSSRIRFDQLIACVGDIYWKDVAPQQSTSPANPVSGGSWDHTVVMPCFCVIAAVPFCASVDGWTIYGATSQHFSAGDDLNML